MVICLSALVNTFSCSLLKPNIQSIKNHLNLIEATQVLVAEHHIANDAYTSILPIQIRLHEDRIQLLDLLLKTKPSMYKQPDFLYRLASQLLGSISLSTREKFLISLFRAKASIRECALDDSFSLGRELAELLPNFATDSKEIDLFREFLSLFLKSDYRNMNKKLLLLSLSSKYLSGSKTAKLMTIWRSTLSTLSVGSHQDPLELYSLISGICGSFSASDDVGIYSPTSPHTIRSPTIDFFQPVGSSISGYYSKPTFARPIEPKDKLSCLVIQNSIRQLELLSEEQLDIHSLDMAKYWIRVDAPLAVTYLLSSKLVK